MQRRLAIALVSTALVTVLLVGFGMLAMAQVGARTRAEDGVTRALNVVVPLLEANDGPVGPGDLQALENRRRDLQLERLEPVAVMADGSVQRLAVRGPGGRAGPDENLLDVQLSDRQRTDLATGETVLVAAEGVMFGLRAPELVIARPIVDGQVALLASRPIVAVPRQTIAWFVLSSIVVLMGALVAGIVLARRLVRPIREIEGVTAALAAGQLAARVQVDGDDELAQLGDSVNRMAADLERSKALDQQFLMSVSHDLRTPLTAIAGYAEALRDGAVTDPVDAGSIIGNHAARLDRLVRDLLDLAKLDANRFRLDLRPVDLVVVTGRTVAGLAPEAAANGVTMVETPAPTTMVMADADRLAQAIGNMVHNAISFAANRVTIQVAVTAAAATATSGTAGLGAVAQVSVIDDGPGFAPEELPHVFDRLYTGRARPRRAENPTGLGLAIVRELAAAMGGAVTAANDAGGGAHIVLSLPLHQAGDRAAATDPTLSRPGGPGPAPSSPAGRPSGPPASPGPPPTA